MVIIVKSRFIYSYHRHITCQNFIDQLYELFLLRGVPEHIRSDNGPEFTAKKYVSGLIALE